MGALPLKLLLHPGMAKSTVEEGLVSLHLLNPFNDFLLAFKYQRE